jgi:translocation and assembly module TamB
MRLTARKWRWIGLGLILASVAFVVIRTWVVPAIILGQVRSSYGGKVVIRSWWFGLNSAGLEGVALGEGTRADAPDWFTADRIAVDVSLGSLIRGRFKPTLVTIEHPRVQFQFDAKGQPTTKIPLVPQDKSKAPAAALPRLVAHDAEVTLHQEGRKPMTITHIEAQLTDAGGKVDLDVKTDDPTWGKVKVAGHLDAAFKNGEIRIDSSPDFQADPEKLERIPFIPAEVWSNLEPRGPVGARVTIRLAADAPKPVHVLTDITLKGTTARLATLQVEASETTGRVVVDDALVKIENVRGKAVDGTLAASGTLDFSRPIPLFRIDLRLKDVDVTKAPAAWQLHELGATGRLSGKVDLQVALPPSGPNLTGTVGEALIENGSFQGIPIKSLSVGLKAEGNDLQYAPMTQGALDKKALIGELARPPVAAGSRPGHAGPGTKEEPGGWVEIWEPALAVLPIVRLATHDEGVLGWSAAIASEMVGWQVKQAPSRSGGIQLPKTISTRIELEDVDLVTILAKGEKFGIKIPVPVAGRLSIKAAATIPVGALRDIKGYSFRGDATLAGASIDHVDVGLLSAHLELVDGVLDLSDFRGLLVDHPSGDASHPPQTTVVPPKTGELPTGGFRAHLRASISPQGPMSATIEGRQLPLGELLAPVLPVPTPLSGELTIKAEVRGDIARMSDPRSWTLEAHADSRRIKYRGATLDQVATTVQIKEGRLNIADLSAQLAGHPLKANGHLELTGPYRYEGRIHIAGWEIAEVLAFVPGTPRPAPASGQLDADGQAVGTLQPFAITTQGAARVLKATGGPLPLGNVVLHWATDREAVRISGLEAHPLGGKVTGEARIPIRPGEKLDASMILKGIDAARISSSLPPGSPTLSGKADGRLKLSMPLDASTVDAEAYLAAPDLAVRERSGEGVHVRTLRVSARAAQGQLAYEATAESLGGKIRFHGSAPLNGDPSRPIARAELQAAGFRLNQAWKGLGMAGGLAELDGEGAIDVNLRAAPAAKKLWARGLFELRDLHYGHHLNLGGLRGVVALSPSSWRLDQMSGELLGGLASGEARGVSSPGGHRQVDFDFKIDRASLARILASVPSLAHKADGFGSVRAAGQLSESLRASAEVMVARAHVLGLPVSDLRVPADIELSPGSGIGMLHARHWTARVAGGMVRGNARLRLGVDQSFQSDVQLTGVDLDILSRMEAAGKKTVSGKLSGKISLSGPNPNKIAKMRGRVDLDLDDASLIEMPVFKQLDRFLGSAKGGGLFEDGDVHGTIANRTLYLESMTLQGKLLQLHATGNITFDGGLDLQVLVNTNDVIPQSGFGIVGLVPGLGQALGRGEEAFLRLASFLENRLLKFRVSGSIASPTVQIDTGVAVGQGAAGFFSSVFKRPSGGR